MTRLPASRIRVLGLYPNRFGAAYAVVESNARLVAYGQLRLRPRTTEEFCAKLGKLVSRYIVHTLVFEEANIKRPTYVRQLIHDALSWAVVHGSPVDILAPAQLKFTFGLRFDDTKRVVIRRLVDTFPELRWRMLRDTLSAGHRNDVFSAIALATAGAIKVQSNLTEEDEALGIP